MNKKKRLYRIIYHASIVCGSLTIACEMHMLNVSLHCRFLLVRNKGHMEMYSHRWEDFPMYTPNSIH